MTDLRVITAEPAGTQIVKLLEASLVEAKAGKLSSIAIASVDREGCVSGVWSKPPSTGLLLGAISRLGHKLNLFADQ